MDITTKGNDDEHVLHSKRGIRRLSCLSFKKGQTDEHYLYPKRKIWRMNRPFLSIIAFAVLLFIISIAWANCTENFPIWCNAVKSLLSPFAILISAGVAWYVAGRTIEENKIIQRRRVTVDYMSRLSWDKDYTDMRKKFLELRAQGIRFSKIAEDYHALPKTHSTAENTLSTEEQTIIDNHDVIRKILNEYEAMAVAIKMGVYDKDIIVMSRKQVVLSDLYLCESFISTTRTEIGKKNEYPNPKAVYEKCCTLYEDWTGKPLQIRS